MNQILYLCSGSCILVIRVKVTRSSTRASLSSRLLIVRLQPASSRYSQLAAVTSFSSRKDFAFAIWNWVSNILLGFWKSVTAHYRMFDFYLPCWLDVWSMCRESCVWQWAAGLVDSWRDTGRERERRSLLEDCHEPGREPAGSQCQSIGLRAELHRQTDKHTQ